MASLLIYKGKIRISYILVLSLPIITFFVSTKIFWGIAVIILILTFLENKGIVRTRKYSLLLFFIVPTFIAFLFSINSSPYYILQSLFYLLTPIIFLSIGMQYSIIVDRDDILKYIIYYGTIGALTFLLLTLVRVGTNVFTDIASARVATLWGSIANVAAIIIILFASRNDINIIQKNSQKIALIVINSMALILTASRTYYLCFLVFLIIFLYRYNKKLMVLFVIVFTFLFSSILTVETDILFIKRIQNSISEISNSQEFSGYDDVNTFYRAYETRQAIATYFNGNEMNLVFGHGLEKMVDLEYYVQLGEDFRRYIPVLHNGYAYLLLREGIFGLICIFLFFYKVIKFGFDKKNQQFMPMILAGMIFSLLISNYVVGTFFSTEMSFAWMFIGVIMVKNEKKLI